MKKNKNMQKEIKKRKITAIVIGLIFFLIALLINKSIIIRLLISLMSIGLITTGICYHEKKIKKLIPFIIILILFVTMIIDTVSCTVFKRFPIYSYNIITDKKTKVYNAIGITVWQCDKENQDLIVTPFYTKGFTCNPEDMDAIDSNSFLQAIVKNYDEYKNNYVKIKGKISRINGDNIVEMQPYEETDMTINGYVSFADNIVLRIILNENNQLDSYDIYDEITVVGLVKNMTTDNGVTYIYVNDSKVVSNINLDDYKINVITNKECNDNVSLIYNSETENLYSYCLSDVMISYDDENTYELSAALSSGKITIDNIISQMNNKEDNFYTSKLFNIIKCDNNYVIGDTKLSLKKDVCSIINETN